MMARTTCKGTTTTSVHGNATRRSSRIAAAIATQYTSDTSLSRNNLSILESSEKIERCGHGSLSKRAKTKPQKKGKILPRPLPLLQTSYYKSKQNRKQTNQRLKSSTTSSQLRQRAPIEDEDEDEDEEVAVERKGKTKRTDDSQPDNTLPHALKLEVSEQTKRPATHMSTNCSHGSQSAALDSNTFLDTDSLTKVR